MLAVFGRFSLLARTAKILRVLFGDNSSDSRWSRAGCSAIFPLP